LPNAINLADFLLRTSRFDRICYAQAALGIGWLWLRAPRLASAINSTREISGLWDKTPQPVLKPSIGFEIKEGEEAQPEEYMIIFRGLRFKPDAEIGPEGML
jgi:hypothetical protein